MTRPIYLDYNATTPHAPEVIEAIRPFLEYEFGNPSSAHDYGVAPRQAVNEARSQMARLLNCQAGELIFTSGGTESNNHAIKGVAIARRSQGNHIIISSVEHPAVYEVCRALEPWGFETTMVAVDSFGMVDPLEVGKAIRPETILISIMHSNNEVGTLQPIEAVSRLARRHGILFHTDAAQSVGKLGLDVRALGVDLLSVAGHKLYAPKGIGALYIREGVQVEKFCHGAGQEMGQRAGTENVCQIIGLGKACELAVDNMEDNNRHLLIVRERLYKGLVKEFSTGMRLNGHPEKRLPNTLSISFQGIAANEVLARVGGHLAASAGAACHAAGISISHVLQAMNLDQEWAKGTIRFSVGKMTTVEEIDRALKVLVPVIRDLQK
ncbi:MAG: cysteine desulfurase [Desulfobulbaceae bacterium]|nr:cysteine desulfurase [Desulfobulbaceae bacterium]